MLSLAEPAHRTAGESHQRALWSPNTASADPAALAVSWSPTPSAPASSSARIPPINAVDRGGRDQPRAHRAGYIVNAPGLCRPHRPRFRISQRTPFCRSRACTFYPTTGGSAEDHIYPVADLKYPFLGVHYTVTVDGHIKIRADGDAGVWRENYRAGQFQLSEFFAVMLREPD